MSTILWWLLILQFIKETIFTHMMDLSLFFWDFSFPHFPPVFHKCILNFGEGFVKNTSKFIQLPLPGLNYLAPWGRQYLCPGRDLYLALDRNSNLIEIEADQSMLQHREYLSAVGRCLCFLPSADPVVLFVQYLGSVLLLVQLLPLAHKSLTTIKVLCSIHPAAA